MTPQELLKRLLTELQESSPKAAKAAVEVLPDVREVLGEDVTVTWLDLVVALSEKSGAAAIKFCKDSPDLFRAMDAAVSARALAMALELADQDANVALEALRHAGKVTARTGPDALAQWAQIGADLAKLDYVLGIEYFIRGPEILSVLRVDDLKLWAQVGVKLVTPNSFGKPDYMAALAFFRTSPVLLEGLDSQIRVRVLSLGGILADRSAEQAIKFLGEAPASLGRIADTQWQARVLQYGALVAEQDAAAALEYLKRAPEVIELAGTDSPGIAERFEKWYRGGMEVLVYNPEAARAYFAVETRKALAALEEAASGVALRSVARILKLFAEGLSGHPVTIRAEGESEKSRSSSDGSTIYLPARLRRYPSKEDNLRLYKVLTAHEAGHLEYGTYALPVSRLADLASQASLRYGRAPAAPPVSLDELFRLYPQPQLIRDLWMMTEDARIEASLRTEYPGLRRDMDAVAREEVAGRSLAHGMSIREMVVELLLQMSAGAPDEVRVPVALEDVVGRAWSLLRSVARPQATAEEVVRAVHRAYVLIEELTAEDSKAASGTTVEDADAVVEPRAGEEQGGQYRPMAAFAHRGSMDAERVRGPEGETEEEEAGALDREGPGEAPVAGGSRSGDGPRMLREASAVAAPAEGQRGAALPSDDEAAAPDEGAGTVAPAMPGARSFLYDEWDGRIQDYRTRWCRVTERTAPEGSEAFLEQTRNRYGGVVGLIRRYFEGIRPPAALRRVRRQVDGEEVDIEAAVEALVEQRAHAAPSDFVYIRRDRRDRDVAAVFLIDLSGSTGQQIGQGGARIIDIEKEGLVLLCEALEAIGDQYAVYGYSGQSRTDVQVLVLKDFDERYGPQVWRRVDALRPMVQNRDGAAIRHALRRLSERTARVKLMLMLSDGRPLDDAYQDEYALEDTKAALREAKDAGVHPFCITVDREARGYLERMYGDVCYLIIDRVEKLPERLPRIYRTLTT